MDEYIIQELVLGLNSIYSNILVQIILYGSVAKNTSTAESDIDIAIILNASSTKKHEEAFRNSNTLPESCKKQKQ